ncbi:MAG: hypothetical protein Fur0011_5990 [Candidatus Microgenomates bacterium]
MFKRFSAYFLLFTLSLVPRFISLGTIPTSLSHDEVDMIIQAHSVRLTGRDLSGSWSPLSLLPNDALMAELSPVINLPAFSLLPNSLFAAHATTALLGSLYPLLIVILIISWGMSHRLAWVTGFLIALSPWHILFSRTSLEQPTSLFFYTLSWIFLSKIFSKNNSLKVFLLSTLSFIAFHSLGFYTYHGYKFSLPLLTLLLAIYNYLNSTNPKKTKILAILLIFIASLYFRIYLNQSSYVGRQSEIIFLDKSRFAATVDQDRSLSLLPDHLNQIFVNKPLAMLKLATVKYLDTISPTQMFLTGEKNGVFSTGRTGYLYTFLIPFVLIGLVGMLMSGKRIEILLLALLATSPLATILHKNGSFAFRSAIFIVLLTIASGVGIEYLNQRYPKFKITIVALALTIISFINFSYVYFGYYPVESSRSYFFADRTLGTYLSHRSDEKILVIDPQPRYIMSYLVLANKDIDLSTLTPLIGKYSVGEENNVYEFGNLTIRRDCPATLKGDYDTVIADFTLVEGLGKCAPINALDSVKIPIRKIVDPKDSGVVKNIYGDRICDGLPLSRYLSLSGTSAFALDKMSKVQFCSSWIIEN